MNRVNREQHADLASRKSLGNTCKNAGNIWRNIGSLRTLLARAERELARELGGYVAVAVVHGDKREEQAGRWGWAGSRAAGAQVAGMGSRVEARDRGLRVRVHRKGGALVGSTLLRRTVTAAVARPSVDDTALVRDANRLAAVEAQVAQLLARVAAQDREIALLNTTIDEMGPVNMRMTNFHGRPDDLESAAYRHPEDEVGDDDDEDEVQDDGEEVDEDAG